MITRIQMNQVASFTKPATLETDKRINLIYGLNGTGKSTIANFLCDPTDARFAACTVENAGKASLLVYNRKFVRDTFYEPSGIQGIFSLSKENKEIGVQLEAAEGALAALDEEQKAQLVLKDAAVSTLAANRQIAVDATWKIKKQYSGGDRVLEFCLKGLMDKKERLFDHLYQVNKPSNKPPRDVAAIKKEAELIAGESSGTINSLQLITFGQHAIESKSLFGRQILGNTDSAVAKLIERLNSSDWVREGLQFLPAHVDTEAAQCPFCQESTITDAFKKRLLEYFDDAYQKSLDELTLSQDDYEAAIAAVPTLEAFTKNLFVAEAEADFKVLYGDLLACLERNLQRIKSKRNSPGDPVTLTSSKEPLGKVNAYLVTCNARIAEHNAKIANRANALMVLREEFWTAMRWQYDQVISRYTSDLDQSTQQTQIVQTTIENIEAKVLAKRAEIATLQGSTINIDEAIHSINAGLSELGIVAFRIEKHSGSLYRLSRTGEMQTEFETLSEGEKTIIAFLYFCELCKGRKSSEDVDGTRVVVIDDPVSSLSHVYLFAIGQLIKNEFLNSKRFEQVFVLTHSLYFFYEITDRNHERRSANQKLFRIVKNEEGSSIGEMKYEHIQNDYQAYWSVINDKNQPPALIANCMRNIIEYFFAFVSKKNSLNDVFQTPELKQLKYQAFCRYIDRESHSVGQNLFDFKEFDYDLFREAFRLVFTQLDYEDHYKQMSAC